MSNTSSLANLTGLIEQVADELAVLSPRDVPMPEVPALLDAFNRLERMGASGQLLLAARAAEGQRWKHAGFASPADWLAAQTGTSTGKARDDLKASERLAELDGVSDAVRDGRLSPDQTKAIADAAAADPAAEHDLLDLASKESLRGLQDEAARRKAEVEDLEARERRIHRDRRCRTWTDRDGAWNLSARGPLTDGSGFLVELERLTDLAFRQARADGIREGRDAYAFDALMHLAGRSHNGVVPSAPGGETEGGDPSQPEPTRPEPTRPEPRRPEILRHLALLHVDLAALVRGHLDDGEICELPGIGPISVNAARELLGDAILKLVITRGHDVLHVTHLGRGANAAQQIALLWKQPICSVAGCNRRARLQNDHRQPFARVRRTELGNLDPLCEHHHERKTRAGWELVNGRGRRDFVPPDHARHPRHDTQQANAPPDAA